MTERWWQRRDHCTEPADNTGRGFSVTYCRAPRPPSLVQSRPCPDPSPLQSKQELLPKPRGHGIRSSLLAGSPPRILQVGRCARTCPAPRRVNPRLTLTLYSSFRIRFAPEKVEGVSVGFELIAAGWVQQEQSHCSLPTQLVRMVHRPLR